MKFMNVFLYRVSNRVILGAFLFLIFLASFPFVKELQSKACDDADSGFVLIFMDDGSIIATHRFKSDVISCFKSRGAEYGVHMRKDKTSNLLGECVTSAQAMARNNNNHILNN